MFHETLYRNLQLIYGNNGQLLSLSNEKLAYLSSLSVLVALPLTHLAIHLARGRSTGDSIRVVVGALGLTAMISCRRVCRLIATRHNQ